MNVTRRTFKKQISSLDAVFGFLDEALSPLADNHAVMYPLQLAVEEFFTNMVKYNPEGTQDIMIGVEREGNAVHVTIVDEDVEPFDVTRAGVTDTSLDLAERPVGGLGIYLSRALLDDIKYSYADRRSTIILIKNVE